MFRRSCASVVAGREALRPGLPPTPHFEKTCRRALETDIADADAARRWFEQNFQPWRVSPARGNPFLTGYYEPEVEGARGRTADFPAPILGRPDDLVSFPEGAPAPLPEGLTAARRAADGSLSAYPDRAAILDGALSGRGLELVHLRDDVEAFMIHVQGRRGCG